MIETATLVSTLLGALTLASVIYLTVRLAKKKKTDIGTAVHLLLLKEVSLIFLFLIVLFSIGEATFASSIHPNDEIPVNGLARYIVHAGISFASAIFFILGLNLFAKSLHGMPKSSPFKARILLQKNSKPNTAKEKRIVATKIGSLKISFWSVYLAVISILIYGGVYLSYYNTYLIAGGLGETALFTDYIRASLQGSSELRSLLFSNMTYSMQAATVGFKAHMVCVVLDGVFLAFTVHIFGYEQSATESPDMKTVEETIEKNKRKAFADNLKYVLNFVSASAAAKFEDIMTILTTYSTNPNDMSKALKMITSVHTLKTEVEKYINGTADVNKKKILIDKIVKELEKSPNLGGFGISVPKK